MQEYLLAQDIGVFSCKAALFTLEGTLVRENSVSYHPKYTADGGAAQSASIWWEAFCENCRTLLQEVRPEAVAAVCICGQMMGCLPVSADGTPLADSIIWEDTRAQKQAKILIKKLGEEKFYSLTGVRSDVGFSITKFMWLKANAPEVYAAADKLIQCKDYINFRLCGVLATDYSDAGFVQAYDLFNNKWSDEILKAAEIDARKLPEVLPHTTVLGTVTAQACAQTGLSTATRVVLGMGDGRTVLVGSGIRAPGDGCIYLSASSWISQVTDSAQMDPNRMLSKTSFLTEGLYTNGGATLCGRWNAEWLMREFASPEKPPNKALLFEELDRQIQRSDPGCHGLIFMPYLRGERAPWWNDSARGAFLGLRSTHTRQDFCRSVFEGVAFNLGIIKNRIERLSPFENALRMVGTCADSVAWRQILADVLDKPILVSDVRGGVGCVGSALLAGVGAGFYHDFDAIDLFHHHQEIVDPVEENVLRYRELIPAFEDCYYALSEINRHLSRF